MWFSQIFNFVNKLWVDKAIYFWGILNNYFNNTATQLEHKKAACKHFYFLTPCINRKYSLYLPTFVKCQHMFHRLQIKKPETKQVQFQHIQF